MRELERVELTTLTMVTDGRGNVLVQDVAGQKLARGSPSPAAMWSRGSPS